MISYGVVFDDVHPFIERFSDIMFRAGEFVHSYGIDIGEKRIYFVPVKHIYPYKYFNNISQFSKFIHKSNGRNFSKYVWDMINPKYFGDEYSNQLSEGSLLLLKLFIIPLYPESFDEFFWLRTQDIFLRILETYNPEDYLTEMSRFYNFLWSVEDLESVEYPYEFYMDSWLSLYRYGDYNKSMILLAYFIYSQLYKGYGVNSIKYQMKNRYPWMKYIFRSSIHHIYRSFIKGKVYKSFIDVMEWYIKFADEMKFGPPANHFSWSTLF